MFKKSLVVIFVLVWMVLAINPVDRGIWMLENVVVVAVFPIVLSRHFGGDVSTAVRAVLVTSALSILTTPLWLSVGLPLVPP